ncbi:hypothetical protein ACIQMP_07695 [Streptomyces sp. NPDC091385]|uniref:hypothetical protein n=1 Tax=Streptomyces sp. NPDC091385 TaxID=3365997 RepID=UPI0037FC2236
MSADANPLPVVNEPVTVDMALKNAARLLRNAEVITDHALMLRTESLADSWVAIARTVIERDRGGGL